MGVHYMVFQFPTGFALAYVAVLVLVPLVITGVSLRTFAKEPLVERLRGWRGKSEAPLPSKPDAFGAPSPLGWGRFVSSSLAAGENFGYNTSKMTSKEDPAVPKIPPYNGFELGPIRPPSEAYSLLLRINRGCGWNKCRFCGFYRDVPFSIRRAEDVKKDIDLVKYWVDVIQNRQPPRPSPRRTTRPSPWPITGCRADALRLFPGRQRPADEPGRAHRRAGVPEPDLPQIQRITTYARSDTINRLPLERLKRYRELKLNRFHIGLETGNDHILKMMRKGVTKQAQIEAGIKAMAAGIEINEFYMPGMGGREYA